MLGTVQSASEDEITITLDENGDLSRISKLMINTRIYSAIEHGYATTIHKSQGINI